MSIGNGFGAVVDSNGKLFMWGSNVNGELGQGDNKSVDKPTKVEKLKAKEVKMICCGGTFVIGVGAIKSKLSLDTSD